MNWDPGPALGRHARTGGDGEQALHPAAAVRLPRNDVVPVSFRRGWPGVFTGESQAKALRRRLAEVNAAGWRVVAATDDRWSFFDRLGWGIVAVLTLGFVVRWPNLLLIVEPA